MTTTKPILEAPGAPCPEESRVAHHLAMAADSKRMTADCVALANAWVERIGLKLPLDDEYVDRFWPLQAQDVELAFLYYFAALAHARPDGSQLFAGIRAGAPHILAKWYPPSFWHHLRRLGIEEALRCAQAPLTVPPLREVAMRLKKRYDHAHLYCFYLDANGELGWSAAMRGAPGKNQSKR